MYGWVLRRRLCFLKDLIVYEKWKLDLGTTLNSDYV
jgi:hypothetical protein